MSRPGMRKLGYEPHDPLAETLGADEVVCPRPEFRAQLRADLLNRPVTHRAWPLAWPRIGRATVPSMPALIAIFIIAMGTALAAALVVNQDLRQQVLGGFAPVAEAPVTVPEPREGPPLVPPPSAPAGISTAPSTEAQSEVPELLPEASPSPQPPRLPDTAPVLVPSPVVEPATSGDAPQEKPHRAKPKREHPTDTVVPTAEAPTATLTPLSPPALPASSTPEPTQTGRPTTTPRPTEAPTATPTAGTGSTS